VRILEVSFKLFNKIMVFNSIEIKDKYDNITASTDAPMPLNCDSFQRYWVAWNKGIQVGMGGYGFGKLMEAPMAKFTRIAAVGLAVIRNENLYDIHVDALWQVEQDNGKTYSFKL
jgi:hypothetical protein